MTKDVLVSVKGLHFTDRDVSASSNEEELDKIETICPGEYYHRNDGHFVVYEEILDGFMEPVKNVIKLRDGEFTISKKGPFNTQMLFMEGRKTLTDYGTPFGSILIGLDTKKIETNELENILDIHVEYGLEVNYQFIADCRIKVHIAEKSVLSL